MVHDLRTAHADGAPTPIPTPQVFDAMSNGQVDGLEADLEFSWNQRFDKVSKTILKMDAILTRPAAPATRQRGIGNFRDVGDAEAGQRGEFRP